MLLIPGTIQPPVLVLLGGFQLGMIVGIYVTPDLDVDAGNISHKKIRVRYGKKAHWAWKSYWKAYAKGHKHRGDSHKPVIGTWGRWWYALKRGGLVAWLLLTGVLWLTYNEWLIPWLIVLSVAAFLGNALQDIGHILFDMG